MSVTASVCEPWATLDDLFDCTECASMQLLVSQGGPVPDSKALENLLIASNIVNRLSAFQFGLCDDKVRPCCADDLCGQFEELYSPMMYGGWYKVMSASGSSCTAMVCGRSLPQIEFGVFPLDSILEVKIDGAVLAPESYRIDNWRYLVRTDGNLWPATQNLLKDDTEVGTWSVSYRYGVAPPPEGVRAVSELACQLTLACAPPELARHCRLPDYVTSVTRQGITFNLASLEEKIRFRVINLPAVDNFVTYVNPNRALRPPIVISPTYNRQVHRRVGT